MSKMNYSRKIEYLEQLKVKADSRGSQRLAEQHSKTVRRLLEDLEDQVEDKFPLMEALRLDSDYQKARELISDYDLD